MRLSVFMFLYIVPLKQGLKLLAVHWAEGETQFLYIVPLKQGLKLPSGYTSLARTPGFYT